MPMYEEQKEILLLQREKYKLKIIENLLETREKVVSTKGAFTVGGTILAGFLAYKGLNWLNNKNKKAQKKEEKALSNPETEPTWLTSLREQAISILLEMAKERLQAWMSKAKK